MKKYVKIVSCASSSLWYYHSIGGVFVVKDVCNEMYLTDHGKSIYKKDCVDHLEEMMFSYDPKYVKIVLDDIAYYLDQNHLERVGKSLKEWPTSRNTIMMHSNFAVNRRTNEIVKCRWSVESIIDKYTGISS